MIAAVVVTHSAPAALLRQCVDALRVGGGPGRIVVVHNGPGEAPRGLGEGVDVVHVENQGYGAAANHGIAAVPGADAYVVMNDDVVVSAGFLAPLVAALDDEGRVGAAQPVLLAEDGTVVSCGVQLDRYGAGSDVGDGDAPPDPATGPSQLEIFNGGAVLLSADFVTDVGGFDERFFLYYEDVDLALRGRASGWTYRLVHASRAIHRRGTTTSTADQADRTWFLQERNRLWNAFRWADAGTIARACWLSLRRVRHRPRRVNAHALVAGLGGAPRELVTRWRRRD